MTIIEGTNSDGTKYYQYQQPDREILRKRFNELLERLEELVKCLPELNFDVEDLAINGRILGDIIVRADKRSDYFLIFHEQTHISEIKKSGIVCVLDSEIKAAECCQSNHRKAHAIQLHQ